MQRKHGSSTEKGWTGNGTWKRTGGYWKNISEGKKMNKNRVGYLTAEEKEREDQEQIEYLRKWKEKREKKREHRRKVKLHDRLFVGRKR